MKRLISVLLLAAMLMTCLSGCGDTALEAVSFDVDAATSKYKHINNGGIEDKDGLPYNVDAITGATLTVEGPAVENSVPLSVREIENLKEGIARGLYKDSRGVYSYEGVDVYYLVHNMSSGASGITLTDTAYSIVFKDANREEISRLTLAEVEAAHNVGRPVILAYGIGTKDEKSVVPFVFDGADKNTHSLGYDSKLKNDDGCVKLVYDNESYGSGNYKTFGNTAYVYVCEESAPGFKHSTASGGFASSRYMDNILTFRGDALGREFDLTTRQLEDLVAYDADGNVAEGGIGYTDWYSLANNAYWYVNEYEGLQLYELLQYLGMPSAEEMGTKAARTTIVNFIAADGAESNEEFSVDTLSYPDAFGFYKKNAQDPGDGTYTPSNADLVKLGYPVLLSYGVNDYPYTILKTDEDYVSGLSNSGGPFRVVFGKTTYAHANGSNQVQQVSEIIAGNDVLYNTHKYTDDAALSSLASECIKIRVTDANGKLLLDKDLEIGEIEAAIYGEDVKPQDKKKARVKDSYELDGSVSVFEGIDAEYFFMDVLKLPGKNGTVTVKGDTEECKLSLEQIFAEGYNAKLQRSGLKSIFAFAKNGSPLVRDASAAGYEREVSLKPFLDTDPKTYTVDNQGGPLMLVVPGTGLSSSDGQSVASVKEISIELVPDSYAHIDSKYAKYQSSTIKFYGPGLEKEKTYKLSELEGKQTMAKTIDYSMLNSVGTLTEERYRGIPVYELFKEIGINNNAGDVTVYCKDGSSKVYSLLSLKKAYENFVNGDKEAGAAMLAFGEGDINGNKMEGTPLTDDGPLKLVVPQESKDASNKSLCLKNVTSVYVSANEIKNWGHAMSDVYSEYLDYEFTITFKNDENEESVVYTVAELEAMDEIRVRANYTVLDMGECEGVDLWKLVERTAGGKIDISDPVSVTVVAEDGFSCDLLSKVYMDGLVNGVESESGDTRKVILSNAQNGYPLVHDVNHEGYTGLAGGAGGNAYGPVRTVVETAQGASLKCTNKIVVTITGNDPISLK